MGDKKMIQVVTDKVFFFIQAVLSQLDDDQNVANMKIMLKSLKVLIISIILAIEISVVGSLDKVLDDQHKQRRLENWTGTRKKDWKIFLQLIIVLSKIRSRLQRRVLTNFWPPSRLLKERLNPHIISLIVNANVFLLLRKK